MIISILDEQARSEGTYEESEDVEKVNEPFPKLSYRHVIDKICKMSRNIGGKFTHKQKAGNVHHSCDE